VLLRRMSLSRSRVFPGVCTKAHEGVFQGAPRGGAHTSPPFFNLMVIQIKDCQRFVSIVFVDSPHSSNEDHVKLDFPISLSVQAISMLCCAFAFWSRGSGLVSSHNLNSIRWTSHWFGFNFSSLASCWKCWLWVVTREEHTVLGKIRMASGREEAFRACAVSFGSNQEGSIVLLAVFLRSRPCSDSLSALIAYLLC